VSIYPAVYGTNCLLAELWDAANVYFNPCTVYYWTVHMLGCQRTPTTVDSCKFSVCTSYGFLPPCGETWVLLAWENICKTCRAVALSALFSFPSQPLRCGGSDSVIWQFKQSHSSPETSVSLQPGHTGDAYLPGQLLLCESNNTPLFTSFVMCEMDFVGLLTCFLWSVHTNLRTCTALWNNFIYATFFFYASCLFKQSYHYPWSNPHPFPCYLPAFNPLPTLCPSLQIPSSLLYLPHLPSLKSLTPCAICLCALGKEVAAASCGAPAPLLPPHAPRRAAREAKAQSFIWWPGLAPAKAQIQSGGLCECVLAPWPS